MKPISYAHINTFHKKGYWFKIWMEILRPLLAKIELICQQPAMPQLRVGSKGYPDSPGVQDRMAGGSWGGLAMFGAKFVTDFPPSLFIQSVK